MSRKPSQPIPTSSSNILTTHELKQKQLLETVIDSHCELEPGKTQDYSNDIVFVVRCNVCHSAKPVYLEYLGLPVRCSICKHKFVAKDHEMESAAMEEEVSEFAKILDWQEEPMIFEPRPR